MKFTGERFIPDATDVEPTFQRKMYQEHLARYIFAGLFVEEKTVLDLGCGVGYGTAYLMGRKPRFIISMDIEREAIRYGYQHYQQPEISFLTADASSLPFQSHTFDVIVAFEVIEHVDRYVRLLEEVRRVLKPGGVFIVSTPRSKGQHRSDFHIHEFSYDELKTLLEARFDTVRLFGENNLHISMINGDGSPGTSFERIEALADFSARNSDYFVAVCGPVEAYPLPVAVINDDSYILNLEKDVNFLQGEVANLQGALSEAAMMLEAQRVSLEDAQQRQDKLAAHNMQIELAAREMELEIKSLHAALVEKETLIADLISQRTAMANSITWRVTEPLRLARYHLECWAKTLKGRKRVETFQAPTEGQPVQRSRRLPLLHRYKVLFLIGTVEGESKRYRVHNVQEYLAHRGIESSTSYEIEIGERLGWMLSHDVLVLMRAGMTPALARLINEAKQCQVPVVFEVDDYVFEPQIIENVAAIKDWPKEMKEQYEDGVRRYRQTLELCDYVFVPTDYLAARSAELGKKSFVVRNGLNGLQVQDAQEAKDSKVRRDGVVLGYFSGTWTHEADLKVAVPAIAHILEEFPETSLCIGGYLQVPNELARFGPRVRQLPFVPWRELSSSMAQVDINLAPLEVGNPFCEAKSELKYFEPALLEIPTVASPTDAYRWAITHGENGFLASTEDEWYQCIKALVRNRELREQIGRNAYRHTMLTYAPEALAERVDRTFREVIADVRQRLGYSSDGLSITWVVPPPLVGSGGHRNIFRAVKFLAQKGHSVRVHVPLCQEFSSSEELTDFIEGEFMRGTPPVDYVLGVDTIEPCDALIATHWTTAYIVDKYRQRSCRQFYFVQDFEPYFYPMGDEYIRAENTYRLGFVIIASGPWCAKLLREQYNAKANYFQFPVDRSVYYPRDDQDRHEERVIFFCRPDMPRRCFPLMIEAAALLKNRRHSVEICLFGTQAIGSDLVPFPHTDLGVLSPPDLAKLYSSAAVGVSFSTTNPSLLPYEMMACKCPVVDLDYGGNELNYGSRENVMLAEPSAERIAEAIERLLSDHELRLSIAENGYRFVQTFPDEETMGRRVEELILAEFSED